MCFLIVKSDLIHIGKASLECCPEQLCVLVLVCSTKFLHHIFIYNCLFLSIMLGTACVHSTIQIVYVGQIRLPKCHIWWLGYLVKRLHGGWWYLRQQRHDPQLRTGPLMPIVLQACAPKHATFAWPCHGSCPNVPTR